MCEEREFPIFLQEYLDLIISSSEKFHLTLKQIRDITNTDSLMSIYEELLKTTNSDFRIRKAVLGTFLISNLKKLSYPDQSEFIRSSIIQQIEFFSNKHLCLLYQYFYIGSKFAQRVPIHQSKPVRFGMEVVLER